MSELLRQLDEVRERELGELRDQVGWDVEEPNDDGGETLNAYIETLESAVVAKQFALEEIKRRAA